jgi:HSP20 family protein
MDRKISTINGLSNPFYKQLRYTDADDILYPILFNSLFDFFTNDYDKLKKVDNLLVSGNNFPKIDVWKEDNKYFISAVIAGIPKEDVEITLNEYNQLIFSYSATDKNSDRKYIKKELTATSFTKKIQLPEYVDTENPKLEYADGIVTISFEFLPERKPKRLEIK